MTRDYPPVMEPLLFYSIAFKSEYTQCMRYHIGKACAAKRSTDWHPGIAPVRSTFTSNRQNCMSDTRAKIAGRVHRISSRSTQRQSQRPNQHTNNVRAIAWDHCANWFRKNHPDDKHQEKCSNELAKECRSHLADCRSGAEDAQFGSLILRLFPMWQISQPDDSSPEDTAQDLHYRSSQELWDRVYSQQRLAERYRRISNCP